MPIKRETKKQRVARQQKETDKRLARLSAAGGVVGSLGGLYAIGRAKVTMDKARRAAEGIKKATDAVTDVSRKGSATLEKLHPMLGGDRDKWNARKRRHKLKAWAKQRRKMPKWRRILNKLPGGRVKLFTSRCPVVNLEGRIASKRAAKKIAFEAMGDIPMGEARRINRKMTKFVRQGRKGVSGVRDIEDKLRGTKRNKRRKFFWEKQSFKDAAVATGLTAAAATAVWVAKRGKGWRDAVRGKIEKPDLHLEEPMEFISGPTIEDVMGGRKKGWRLSRPTSKSVRVHVKGKRRDRRRKKFYERTGFKNKAMMGLAALALASPLAYKLGYKRGGKAVAAGRKATKGGGYTVRKPVKQLKPDPRADEFIRGAKKRRWPGGGGWETPTRN